MDYAYYGLAKSKMDLRLQEHLPQPELCCLMRLAGENPRLWYYHLAYTLRRNLHDLWAGMRQELRHLDVSAR